MPYSALSHLDCPRCGARHDADRVQGTCSCGSPLLARYDLRLVRASRRDIAGRPPGLWRYHELLPLRDAGHVVSLGEGMTPLLALPTLGRALGVPDLLMKDESLIPTGTIKARGSGAVHSGPAAETRRSRCPAPGRRRGGRRSAGSRGETGRMTAPGQPTPAAGPGYGGPRGPAAIGD